MPEPIIRIDNIVKRYGPLTVLDGLSMEVMPGEKLALIGPSGSGKTTILRILMTLESITGGHIQVDGEQLYHMPRNGDLIDADERHLRKMRAKIGMVFQHFNLFPHKTVLDNVTLAPILTKGIAKSVAEKRAMELLDMVGMTDKAGHVPAQLSGGQKQRAAIARALALSPRIMLFDEVTSALDPELVNEVLEVIRRLAVEDGLAMIISTHQLRFAADVADRVVFLSGGSIVEEGPADEVLNRPRHPLTARFLSKMEGE